MADVVAGDGFQIHLVSPGLHRVALQQPEGTPEPYDVPTNVYVARGEGAIGLVNTGHASMQRDLERALAALDIRVVDVDRVVITGLWPDLYGGIAAFPCADAVVRVPPQRIEARLARQIADLRTRFLDAGNVLSEWIESRGDDGGVGRLLEFVERYLTPLPRNLRVLPVRGGFTVNLAGRFLRVIDIDGGIPGQIALHDPQTGDLFSADATPDMDEGAWITDARALDGPLRDLFELDPPRVLPNRGAVRDGHMALKRANLYLNNFLSNVTFATDGRMNAAELVHRDLGIGDRLDVRFVTMTLGYRALIATLIREDLVDGDADDEGLLARFGLGETPTH